MTVHRCATIFFSILGYYVSLVLAGSLFINVAIPCGRGNQACSLLQHHPLGKIGGIPWAYFGVAFFTIVVAAILFQGPGASARAYATVGLLVSCATIISLYLLSVMVYTGYKCYWCMISALCCGALFGLHFSAAKRVGSALNLSIRLLLVAVPLVAVCGTLFAVKESSLNVRANRKLISKASLEQLVGNNLGLSRKSLVIFTHLQCGSCAIHVPQLIATAKEKGILVYVRAAGDIKKTRDVSFAIATRFLLHSGRYESFPRLLSKSNIQAQFDARLYVVLLETSRSEPKEMNIFFTEVLGDLRMYGESGFEATPSIIEIDGTSKSPKSLALVLAELGI